MNASIRAEQASRCPATLRSRGFALVVGLVACVRVWAADFPLVQSGRAAPLVVAAADAPVVQLAAADLAADIERVSGVRPVVTEQATGPRVLIGTLGQSPALDALVAAGRLEVAALRGAWESFLIATVDDLLVVAGSDRRGTAFGVYELSQQIGVSPWHWWADVAPEQRPELLLPAGLRRYGPPSVKYRGIFLNDEDWGLQPWAARTFEPEHGDIGPKTYARIFELLLRLKANTLWPAMHACTRPFNADPRHAALADRYAIVMGSSHAEPMLRNNVGEWTAPKPDYNYVTNRAGVRAYWEERVRANGRYENLYTLGMRGIHDSAIQGARTDPERITVLTQVFADQRALLSRHVRADVAAVPQIFCAYKEVLDLYRQGLHVPDDVTIVWPDNNFGYVRQFAAATERTRSGGFGVYYHISYLGRPLAYLWLHTTPPALVWSEMTKSYAHGADRLWIVNVGDLKPAEIGTEFFLQLAWDVRQWGADAQPRFLRAWAAREFGSAQAEEIAAILERYYTLNFARKPEHLQWWLPVRANDPTNAPPGQPPYSDFTATEIDARLAAFADLRARVEQTARRLPAAKQDAFFELVGYPVHGAALANDRYFRGERGQAEAARAADAALRELTRHFNEDTARGKWRGFLRLEPADDQWKTMRIAPWAPETSGPRPAAGTAVPPPAVELRPQLSADHRPAPIVAGLGRSGQARLLAPGTELHYEFGGRDSPAAAQLVLECLPTHPVQGGRLRLTATLDGLPLPPIDTAAPDGGAAWAQGVLRGVREVVVPLPVLAPGKHRLHLAPLDEGLVLDRATVRFPL